MLEEDLDQEMDEVFGADEEYDAISEKVKEAQKTAEDYLQIIKSRYPNRYFILKKITQNPYHWEVCLQKNYVIISDVNYTRKLQNCFEVPSNLLSWSFNYENFRNFISKQICHI